MHTIHLNLKIAVFMSPFIYPNLNSRNMFTSLISEYFNYISILILINFALLSNYWKGKGKCLISSSFYLVIRRSMQYDTRLGIYVM